MENINSYNRDSFTTLFKTTAVYDRLTQDYTDDQLVWHKFFHIGKRNFVVREKNDPTPRAQWAAEFSAAVFYYLLPLLEKNPTLIYDLGCGKNMFKSYLPNVVGVGPDRIVPTNCLIDGYNQIKDSSWPPVADFDDFDQLPDWIKKECVDDHGLDVPGLLILSSHFHGDQDGLVDDEYVEQHRDCFDAVFSICAMHFHSLQYFRKIVLDFASMIRKGGRGFLSLNLQRMIERADNDFLIDQFQTVTPTVEQYDHWLRRELSTTDLKFLILDIDLTLIDEGMDGNIRVVIER